MALYTCENCGKRVPVKYEICPFCHTPRPEDWDDDEYEEYEEKKKKSVLLLISAILGVLYAIFIVTYFAGVGSGADGAAEAIGAGIATMLVMPHMICAVLAAIFNVLGWGMSSRGFSLTGAILYAVADVLFPVYAMFVLIQMILSFIGFARLKKLNP